MTDTQDQSQAAEPVATPEPTPIPTPAPSEPLLRGGSTLEPGTALPIVDMIDRHEMSAPRPDNILKGVAAPQPGLRGVANPPAPAPAPAPAEPPVQPPAEPQAE